MPEVSGRPDDPDVQRTIRAERTERPDGRYLIYYSWPEEQSPEGGLDVADDPCEASTDV